MKRRILQHVIRLFGDLFFEFENYNGTNTFLHNMNNKFVFRKILCVTYTTSSAMIEWFILNLNLKFLKYRNREIYTYL